jgi:hypothetical protein
MSAPGTTQPTLRGLTATERQLVPFDFLNPVFNETDQTFEATFQGEDVFTVDLNEEWGYLNREGIVSEDLYNFRHPGLEHLRAFNRANGTALYKRRHVRWSDKQRVWLYANNRPVNFGEDDSASIPDPDPDIPETPTTPQPSQSLPGGFFSPSAPSPSPTPKGKSRQPPAPPTTPGPSALLRTPVISHSAQSSNNPMS